jgi:sulfopyruvate decarboxylase subunit beta
VVFDNESLMAGGGVATATAAGADLAGMARAAGIPDVRLVRELEEFRSAFQEALAGDRLSCLVAKVEAVGAALSPTEVHMLENRFEFARAMRA